MTREECAKLVPGDIVNLDGAFMVLVNDPSEEEVKLSGWHKAPVRCATPVSRAAAEWIEAAGFEHCL